MASYRYERDIDPADLAPRAEKQYTRKERWANWWDYNLKWVIIIGIIVAHNAASILACSLIVAVAVILHNVLGLALGYGLAALTGSEPSKRSAIAIEVGMQNSGLATSLATTHFALFPLAAVPGAMFSVWHNFSGSIAAQIFRKQAERKQEKG